jgi:hypothetical protein
VRPDQLEQLPLELFDAAGQLADVGDLLARDAYPRAGGQLSQAPVDAVEHARLVERAGLD